MLFLTKISKIIASEAYKISNFSGILYHGSPKPIKNFNVSKGKGRYGTGLYLTPSLEIAKFYAAGGRQGSAQRLKENKGHIYSFNISGKVLKIFDEYKLMQDVAYEYDEAEKDFQKTGDVLSSNVTRHLGPWAQDYHQVDMVWLADRSWVLAPLEQVLILNQSAIKSFQKIV